MNAKQSSSRRNFLKLITCAFAAGAIMPLHSISHAAQAKQKILTVFFSHTNNTRMVAQSIHSIMGGDIVELKTVKAYPTVHDETVTIAIQENKSHARPELSTVFPENMGEYDIVFAGYPVWEYTIPMAFFTFFDRYKFPGKTIIPFSTHMGSQLGGGPRDIAQMCPDAKIVEGIALRGVKAKDSQPEVARWLKTLAIASE